MTLTWAVDGMTVEKSQDGLTDVVTWVQWRLTGEEGTYVDSDGETVANTASVYGSLAMDAPDPDSFTDFVDLSKSEVIGWVQTKLETEMVSTRNPDEPDEMMPKTELYEGLVQKEIEQNVSPTSVSPELPWDEDE